MTQTTADQIAAVVTEFAPVAQMVADVLLPGAGTATAMGIKLALGALNKVPAAISLVEQFQSGQIPTQADLDAYAVEENDTFNKLIADIDAAKASKVK